MANVVIDLSLTIDEKGFVIQGDQARDNAGWSVSAAGDGIDDLIICAFNGDDGGADAGESYVIFGKPGATRNTIDLSSLGSDGFIIQGDQPGDLAGHSVSGAGDVNSDGIGDLIVGARRGDDGGNNAGGAYVIFGRAGATRSNIDLSALGNNGFVIWGDTADDQAGFSVSAAGDVNSDGIDDLLIGARLGDDGGLNAGEAYVIFGAIGLGSNNQPPIIDAEQRSYTTLADTQIEIAVTAVDPNGPNGDPLCFSADAPVHALSDGGNGTFTYVPDQGFSGLDNFTITVLDGNGGSAEQAVEVSITALPDSDEWRLFSSDGYVGELGGSGTVIGTSGYQNIGIVDRLGTITFDPSFNRGGDIIRLAGYAADWRIMRSGLSAILLDGDTFVTVPVGTSGLLLAFDDGGRLPRFDSAAQTFRIGEQDFTATLVPITPPAQDIDYPIEETADSVARLFLAEAATIAAGADAGETLDIFGTSATERVQVLSGDVRLDPSYNRGGDVLAFHQPANDFTAVRSGSSIQLDSVSADILIPLGTYGITLAFANGDDRALVFDALTNSAIIGDQQISFAVAPLSEVAQTQWAAV
jgi:hypothetical protein